MHNALTAFFIDIWRRQRWRVILLVVLLVAAGLVEGLGVALLLPLLNLVGVGDSAATGALTQAVRALFSALSLPLELNHLLILIIVVFAIQATVVLTQSWQAASMQAHYMTQWRDDLMDAFLRSGWPFFYINRSSEMINVLINETLRLGGGMYLLVQLVAVGVINLIYIALAFTISWQITSALLVAAVSLFFATRGIGRWSFRVGTDISSYGNKLQEAANELLGGGKLIKATATEDAAIARFTGLTKTVRQLFFWHWFHPNFLRVIFETSAIIGLCVLLATGTSTFGVDPAAMLIILGIFLRLYPRLSTFQQNLQLLNVYLPAVTTAQRMLRAARDYAEMESNEPLHMARNDGVSIDIRDLHFSYGDESVLDGIDMHLPAGKIIGIVGGSGAGKSTLVDCLLHLVEPQSGAILIDDRPLGELPLNSWRRSVGYVAQDTFLFNDSIINNMRWGQPDATEEQVAAAARKAHAHDFIMRLPEGYNTIVGDRGIRLSGGQRQRLGLTRALVQQPPLLILDEATSALDSESERAVLDAIRELKGHMTIVSIAHRLSTMRDADVIYVLEAGRIVEQGTWTDLLDGSRHFRQLWQLQQQSGA